MDINALKTFLEVSKTLHFANAANNLCVSQSTVSARIKALEESLNTQLFIRERSNIHLSENGEALVSHAKSIMTIWNRARQEAASAKGSAQETIVIGGLSGLWDITLQDWLSEITKAKPDLSIIADIFSPTTLIERIMNGTMDIAFLYDAPQNNNIITQPVKTIHLKLVSTQQMPDAYTALSNGYINVDWGTNFAVQFASEFPDVFTSRLNTGLGRIAFEHLKKNNGCAYLAESMIQDDVKKKNLYYVPNAPIFQRKAYAIYLQDHENTDLIQFLINKLERP